MSDAKLLGTDVFESVTGFEEIAIAQRFGRTVTDLATEHSTMFTRSLIFVVKKREGANDEDAYKAALEMSLKEAGEFFILADDDDTSKDGDEGKALTEPESEPELPPVSSLSSVS